MSAARRAPMPRKGRGRVWPWALVALAGSLLGVGVLALLLVPPLKGALETRIADGAEAFAIGSHAEIVPGAGWSVRPDEGGSLLLSSPDRLLEVTVVSADSEGRVVAEIEQRLEEAGSLDALLEEVLADGSAVQHVTEGARIAAALDTGGELVLLSAEAVPPAELTDYRATFAEQLLAVEPLD